MKQAYIYERSRDHENNVTLLSTILKHNEAMYEIHPVFEPYIDPFENVSRISKKKLKKITYQLFHNEWKVKLETSPKADTYKKIKQQMHFEQYLLHKNRKERVAFTKLRVSDHKLRIEQDRHIRPKLPRENRKCYMCKDKVEDEIHFLTECRLYGSHSRYWNLIYEKFPQLSPLSNEERFIFIMTQEDEELTKIILKMNYESQAFRKFIWEYFL